MAGKLILIGGFAGSGKSYIGKKLSQDILNSVFLDKDTLSNVFTEELLKQLGSYENDRESEIYLQKIRPLEYITLMKNAFENLELNKTVICVAPFIKEFNDREWFVDLKDSLKLIDSSVYKIWVHVDENVAHSRIISRKATRDNSKLLNWNEYANKAKHVIPQNIGEHIVVDNTFAPIVPLQKQLEDIILKIN